MTMQIKPISDAAFAPYGKLVEGYDFTELLSVLRETTEKPEAAVLYEPSVPQLEALPIAKQLQNGMYGGMPIQLGCCNGSNTKLNCLEYHRDSEINIVDQDTVLLLAKQWEVQNNQIDASAVEAFLVPAGAAVELYATTLHYAPANATKTGGFRVVIVLPKGTNTEKPSGSVRNEEDRLLWACNKWLIAHADAAEAAQGAYVGITGENPDISGQLA